jgi:hypothetical protein
MSSGQTLLVLGALIFLSLFILRVNYAQNGHVKNSITNEAIITATGLAQTLLEQIQTESFDQNTVLKTVSTPDSLTAPSSLGKDAGETSFTTFNDIDDYNNYTETDTMGLLGAFYIKAKVNYCTKMNPDIFSSVPTFSKRIDVFVYSKYLFASDTLKLSKVISYY